MSPGLSLKKAENRSLILEEEKDFEMAEQLAQAQRDSQIEAARRALAPQTHQDFDGENCIDCGNKIQEERLAMRRICCTICQSVREKKDKLFMS
jgi:RNA polymerase-binding transcription factor DksA